MYGRQEALPSVVIGDLAMLAIGSNFFDKVCLDLRRSFDALVHLREGSKTPLAIVTGMVEENFLMFAFSSCKLGHTSL